MDFHRFIAGRSSLVLAVFFVAFLNGISEVVFRYVKSYGLWSAVCGTFGISIIVFACLFLIFSSLDRQIETKDAKPSMSDWRFFAAMLAMIAVPHPAFSWIAITLIALREHRRSLDGSPAWRAAILMLGITFPMFWGRLVFSLLSGWILKGDAILVSLLTNSQRAGNVVDLPNNSGFLWIAAPCSSFANISLAVLCWLAFTAYSERPKSAHDYMTCALAILNVVMINVGRIALLARRPDLYDTIHGPLGATVVSWLTAIVVLLICASGVKREQTSVDAVDHGISPGRAAYRA